jgi:hypothetical protein
VPTDRGNALGANVKTMRNGTPFVVWPESILNNAALRDSVAEQTTDIEAIDRKLPVRPETNHETYPAEVARFVSQPPHDVVSLWSRKIRQLLGNVRGDPRPVRQDLLESL